MTTAPIPQFRFADSEAGAVAVDADILRIRFAAARVDDGWLQSLDLALAGAAWTGTLGECIGRIAEGQVRVDGRALARLAVPCELAGDIALELRFANATTLSARGRALSVTPPGDAQAVDDFSC